MKMRLIDVYNNLKKWNYDIGGYKINKAEADEIIKVIKEKLEDKKREDDLK